MTVAEASLSPVDRATNWLLHTWDGPLRPVMVDVRAGQDYNDDEAWFFDVTFPAPDGDTWDADQLAELNRAFREVALAVGLSFPWYINPKPPAELDVVPEDDEDIPDDE